MKRIRWQPIARWGLPLLCTPLLLTGCSNGSGSPTAVSQSPTLSVYLKDAPGAVDSVWVQIDDIKLVGDSGSVSVLAAPTGLINVTALQDSVTALTSAMPVDSGTYSQVRFVLGGAVLETVGGGVYVMGSATPPNGMQATGTLMCPSCAQSGLKVQLSEPVDIVAGGNGLLLDFDVSQSFGHQAGASGRWIMHPVIHGATASPGSIEGGNVGGTIAGTVVLGTDSAGDTLSIPACGGDSALTLETFVPMATATTLTDSAGNALAFSGETDSTGVFKVDVSQFDTYSLGYQATTPFDSTQLNWTATVAPTQATVDSANAKVNGVTYTITGVTCSALTQ